MTKRRWSPLSGLAPKPGVLLAVAAPIGLLLTACNGEATPTSDILGQFPSATAITIQDDWTGLSPVAPLRADYSLVKSTNGYQGTATFSAGGYSSPQSATETITIPLGVAQEFLKQLAAVPLEAGEYQPKLDHTDDYPSVSIEIQMSNQSAHFYSQSQGTDNVPWGADIAGMKYTINSGQPAHALTMLAPYLKHETLDNLADNAMKNSLQPTVTPH